MEIDCLILGAGAAGLMCAAHAGGRCLVVDHAKAPGEKIRISGGGRCNFTNLHAGPENFLSANPHFCKSALNRYTQWDFLDLVARHGIPWHEKAKGELFCDRSAKDIIGMLLAEAAAAGAELWLETEIGDIAHADGYFRVELTRSGRRVTVEARSLVVATGGKSIPKMGATGLAYRIAERFGLPVTETRPALVPLTFGGPVLDRLRPLAGLSAPAEIACDGAAFRDALLFTHRGLSGPAILQVSSYWREGDALSIRLCPETDLLDALRDRRRTDGRKAPANVLSEYLPARLASLLVEEVGLTGNLADQSDAALRTLTDHLSDWRLTPSGSEGYRTAEVTLGGVDTSALSSRSMQATALPGLYFIGECVDVTGWLGGYNFQWAWSSGWAAGTAIAGRRG
ncbi:NAD(P)/FAD-dependent oxidoreductase [Tropicimonas sp. IMCC6043]|uniref:NAD(P)/FAD-dependent oxidoreductase n=1 Tax=Tropicimonas sp. IMCC6043 TaxID=2510645 RepID=UPI00101BD301|nr:NAD(P)/FAD-dependent oxidoreductase [Tropicimonas sp. IMCC6043]RYH07659.1 NAD(P)/FAD-dependent oxidoreductase [Tropicimonas sp. IMCC6043]